MPTTDKTAPSKPVVKEPEQKKAVPKKTQKPKKRFRVLRGCHQEGGKTYKRGEVVETDNNLLRFNSPGAIKFSQLSGDVPADSIDGNTSLEAMGLEQLLQLAVDEEIDISGLASREAIYTKIKSELS